MTKAGWTLWLWGDCKAWQLQTWVWGEKTPMDIPWALPTAVLPGKPLLPELLQRQKWERITLEVWTSKNKFFSYLPHIKFMPKLNVTILLLCCLINLGKNKSIYWTGNIFTEQSRNYYFSGTDSPHLRMCSFFQELQKCLRLFFHAVNFLSIHIFFSHPILRTRLPGSPQAAVHMRLVLH